MLQPGRIWLLPRRLGVSGWDLQLLVNVAAFWMQSNSWWAANRANNSDIMADKQRWVLGGCSGGFGSSCWLWLLSALIPRDRISTCTGALPSPMDWLLLKREAKEQQSSFQEEKRVCRRCSPLCIASTGECTEPVLGGRIVPIPSLGSSGEDSSEEHPGLVLFQQFHPQSELRLLHFHICTL